MLVRYLASTDCLQIKDGAMGQQKPLGNAEVLQQCAVMARMLLDMILTIHEGYTDRTIATTLPELLCSWVVMSSDGPLSIASIAKITKLSRPAVRDHVKHMVKTGLALRVDGRVVVNLEYFTNQTFPEENVRRLRDAILRAAAQLADDMEQSSMEQTAMEQTTMEKHSR